MKQVKIKALYWMLLLLGISCAGPEPQPLPPLSYFGEEPRVQNPLSPEESQQHVQVPEGFEAVLYAAEPNIINPIAMAWDERGRLWVVQSQDYPHELENDVGGDRITICEDTDGDGKADKFTDFATEQSLTTGIVIVKGGAIVAQAPDMIFLEDSDGDDKADKRTVLFGGFGIWDTHAGPANLKYGPDNMIWGSVGYSGFENQFEGKEVNFSMGVYRFSRDGKFFQPVGKFNNNTWGLGFNEDFEIFGSTANNNHACYVGISLKHYEYLEKRPSWAMNADFIQGHYDITPVDTIPLQQVDVRGGFTAAAGANFYVADNYPEKYQNQMYVNEPTGHLVHLAKIVEDGAGFQEVDGGNIFASTDAWTAPVFSETGPDGNLWVADWYNPVIQHNPDRRGMPNQIWNDEKGEGNAHLNELRDKKHGRIYIIKYKNKKSKINSINPESDQELIAGIKSDNIFWRTTAQRLIVENQKTTLIPELTSLVGKNNPSAAHALWTLNGLGALDGNEEQANEALEKALSLSNRGLVKAALALLPETEEGSQMLLDANLLSAKDLYIRKEAILRASELPETDALFEAIKSIALEDDNQNDKWLKAALKIYYKEQNIETLEPNEVNIIVPSAEEGSSEWSYTTAQPSGDWMEVDFDDKAWEKANSLFGTPGGTDPKTTTPWNTADIWLRKKVNLDGPINNPVLKVVHDEDYEVYVNGKLLYADQGWGRQYKLLRLDAHLGQLFKKGENTIAVHGHNENGNQHIDIGIAKVGEFKADKQIEINTVSQKMAYDKTEIHATAGQKVEIKFNNTDEMPHNLVLIQKGSLEEFGKQVDKFLTTEKAAELEYVPPSRYVIAASNMLDPGESEVLRIRIPDEPGEYRFICTFPGHWRMMQGILLVSPKGTYRGDGPDPLTIASMGGGSSHNFLKFFGESDGQVLSQGGKNSFLYTEKSEQLAKWLPEADVLIISNNKAFDDNTKKAIFEHVNQGKPMMIYHPSIWYNWEDWPEYNRQLVAGGSRSHEKLQEFEVKVVKPNHPIMKGVPKSFRIVDELYRYEKDPSGPAIEVLAIAKGLESGDEFPAVWVVKHPRAKVINNTLGHDERAHDLPAYKTILKNSLDFIKPVREKESL